MAVTDTAKLKQVKFNLEGLDCAACAAKIEYALHKQGFDDAAVNFAAKSVLLNPLNLGAAQAVIREVDPQVTLIREENQYKAEQKIDWQLILIGAAAFLFIAGLILSRAAKPSPLPGSLAFMAAFLLVGAKVIRRALHNISRGQVFDENFLMTVAGVGAMIIGQQPEAASVMLFYAVGEYLENLAVHRSRRTIKSLLAVRPDYANLSLAGEIRRVQPEEVPVGSLIVIRPGEKVPLDGVVLEGSSFLDTSVLTGESVPRKAEPGDVVLAGMVNGGGLLTIKVSKSFADSSVAKILDLVENAAARKAPTEQFITRFARYYTPAVVLTALGIALIPPLIMPGAAFKPWIYRALILLVISCPCALVISVPLGYFAGIGGASRRGILVKGANFFEVLADLDTVVLDKTGTLTRGVFEVSKVESVKGFSTEDVLKLAALAEMHSSHPIAKAVLAAGAEYIKAERVQEYLEIPGQGVKAVAEGKTILAGSKGLLQGVHIPAEITAGQETGVYVAVDGALAGYIAVTDRLKPDAAEAVQRLKSLGINQVAILSGDSEAVTARVAREVGVDSYYSGLLPEGKVAALEELQARAGGAKARLAFVGDGINDAPVISRADVGIAMGGLGSDAAIEAADVVIMDDLVSKLGTAVELARSTRRIVQQNIVFALGIKAVFIGFGAFGLATMWEAVFADVGVTVLAVLNSARAMRL